VRCGGTVLLLSSLYHMNAEPWQMKTDTEVMVAPFKCPGFLLGTVIDN